MQTMTRWILATLLTLAGLSALPRPAMAQQDGTRIHSSAEQGLKVDGWEMLLPEIIEEDDGRMWVRYTRPDGGYESLPFKVGDPLTVKWVSPDGRRVGDYPAGWSIEDTQAVVDWHMGGGRGDYVIAGGEWQEAAPAPTPPATPRATASRPDTGEDDCSGPYCDRPVSGVQSVSTADDPDRYLPPPPAASSTDEDPIRALGEQVNAANLRCSEARRGGDRDAIAAACQEAERLNLEYRQKLGGG